MSIKKGTKHSNSALPNSIRVFFWSLAVSLLIAFGLPLLFDIYLSLTPQLAPHLENESKKIAQLAARFSAYAVFVMGVLLAFRRWREEQKLKEIQKKVREFRQKKKEESQKRKI